MRAGGKSAKARKPSTKSNASSPAEGDEKKYIFSLFISGSSEKSIQAIQSIKRICDENFPKQYKLEVVDVFQQPHLAQQEQVVAVPALLQKSPGPRKQIVGDFSKARNIEGKINRA